MFSNVPASASLIARPLGTQNALDFPHFSFVSWIEQVYDCGMLSSSVVELLEVAKRLDMAVDGDDIAAVAKLRDWLLAKTMAPLRAFDESMLYQLSKASSTGQFLERCAGLAPNEARAAAVLARKLKAMPLTEAAWLAGTIASGQVHAITTNVTKRLAERYANEEATVLRIIGPLDAKETEHRDAEVGELHRRRTRRRRPEAGAGGRVLPFQIW